MSGLSTTVELDMICAAAWGNYKIHEYFELATHWQAKILAAYQVVQRGQAVVAYHEMLEREAAIESARNSR